MSGPSTDERPWDLRLVQWMSKDADKAQPNERGNPIAAVLHLPLIWISTLASGSSLMFLLAIGATVTSLWMVRRARARHSRSRRIDPANPFGR